MLHYFDAETACAYGVTEALLLNHFAYWIARNREAGRNFREGRTWTHCTMKELGQVFPYLTKGQIRHALEGLREKGVLLTGRLQVIDRPGQEPICRDCPRCNHCKETIEIAMPIIRCDNCGQEITLSMVDYTPFKSAVNFIQQLRLKYNRMQREGKA